jgi:hypothetical protein
MRGQIQICCEGRDRNVEEREGKRREGEKRGKERE